MNYKLSIIIPTYNSEKTIENTFNSIKSQTIGFENIELIFIDDNSEDITLDILMNYSSEYGNVKVFKTNKNSGFAGRPRNIGIAESNTDYILFLDSDDELFENTCEVFMQNITSENCDIVIGGHINRDENNSLDYFPPLDENIENKIIENIHDANLLNITPAISSKLFKKELLLNNNILFIEDTPAQDLVFLIEAILNSNKISILNSFYAYYRNLNQKSISFNPNEKYIYGLIKAYGLVCKLFERFNIGLEIQESIFKKHLSFFTTQVLRTFYLNDSDNTMLHQILNSEQYSRLSQKAVFEKNTDYAKYFELMQTGYYTDAKRLLENLKFNNSLINKYTNLKSDLNTIENINKELMEENKKYEAKINNQSKALEKLYSALKISQDNNKKLYKDNLNFKKTIDKTKSLQKDYSELNKKNHMLSEKLNKTINEKNNLINENIQLKNELIEIKSTKIWKLKNKL